MKNSDFIDLQDYPCPYFPATFSHSARISSLNLAGFITVTESPKPIAQENTICVQAVHFFFLRIHRNDFLIKLSAGKRKWKRTIVKKNMAQGSDQYGSYETSQCDQNSFYHVLIPYPFSLW